MNHDDALSRAKLLVEVATAKRQSHEPVDDETWNELIEIGNWTKNNLRPPTARPELLAEAVPAHDSIRSWLIVEHAAQAIVQALTE